ncbi:MAG: hypothetical protein IJA85_08080 [Clostridia bacterium]|nr:hypothetical protein [Clostridia bacterium]
MREKLGLNGKAILLLLAIALIGGSAVGASLAWITASTEAIVNTFTYSDIGITLSTPSDKNALSLFPTEETTSNKMVPGNAIAQNTTIVVDKDSESCWLFVKIEKSLNFDEYMAYEVADGWTLIDPTLGVYYRQVPTSKEDLSFDVLKNNQVTVHASVTKEQFDALTEATLPNMTISAYAVQMANITTAEDAWAKAYVYGEQNKALESADANA